MSEIVRIVIPNYIRELQLSKARKAKYYEMVKGKVKGSKPIPKKYLTEDYAFIPILMGKTQKLILCEKKTKTPVIANPQAQGTPKMYVINGQDLYNQNMHPQTRRKVVLAIKENFKPYLLKMEFIPEDYYPLRIDMEVHDLITDPLLRNQSWDMDNRSHGFYSKAFQDLLKAEGKIIDDNIKYITGPPAPLFYPVERTEDRKLVFVIRRDTRKEILNHPHWKK